jgi:hypothetical protein
MRLNHSPPVLYFQVECVEHVLQHIVSASTADETRCRTHAGFFVFLSLAACTSCSTLGGSWHCWGSAPGRTLQMLRYNTINTLPNADIKKGHTPHRAEYTSRETFRKACQSGIGHAYWWIWSRWRQLSSSHYFQYYA